MNYTSFSVNIIYSFVECPVVFFSIYDIAFQSVKYSICSTLKQGPVFTALVRRTTAGNLYNIYIIIECIYKINLNSFVTDAEKDP